MPRKVLFLASALLLGGLVATCFSSDHQTQTTKKQADPAIKIEGASFVLSYASAMADHTPVLVIRPETPMLIIDHGNVAVPAFVAPVLPVAHGPPVGSC